MPHNRNRNEIARSFIQKDYSHEVLHKRYYDRDVSHGLSSPAESRSEPPRAAEIWEDLESRLSQS